MSWANLKELIFQERKMLDATGSFDFPQESPFETQQSALLGCYLRTKSDIDAAVRAFSETLEWPELTSLERYFLSARLDFAWEITAILSTAGGEEDSLIGYPSPQKGTTAELLRWLLIDIWPYACGRFLQSQKWLLSEQERAEHLPPFVSTSTAAFASANVA